jgi:hypothetical protein
MDTVYRALQQGKERFDSVVTLKFASLRAYFLAAVIGRGVPREIWLHHVVNG